MIYKDFQGLKLSALGMGTMRLPVLNGDEGSPDEAAVQQMVDLAMASGVNYYDTAWGYHNKQSEPTISRCLRKYDRSSYYLATKFPGYSPMYWNRVEEIFEKQLDGCVKWVITPYERNRE